MQYRVVYTSRAKRDLHAATEYIAARVPETAEKWFDGFVETLAKLKNDPLFFGLAPESKHVEAEIRQVIYRTKSRRSNRALFTVRDQTVFILCIRRPGQKLLSSSDTKALLSDLPSTDEQ